ncbi:ADP-ribose pyrophosphatase [Heyndrickxia sporothermodurans]|uniref:NUDIX hydrolase n=1 Tax=Heyndrickxia TaxID=2837504 RepID=UPI000D38E540|nr:NUDIX hydrolase [Heyndrickxia sporothermodurans]PTY76894.1 ADP-ribose pyrophosphatase [Heyndrickxia sporothermodurans]
MELKWLEWVKQLQAIAQAGLTYSNDIYDKERFELIRKISIEILSNQTNMDTTFIKDLFANETGYQTPKVDIRAVVLRNKKILLVKEKTDNKWALPGGWADIGLSPSEVAVKEVKEESGYDVKAVKLLGILDKKYHPHPPSLYHVYKVFIQCEIIGGMSLEGIETSDVSFFAENELPELSEARNTKSQIEMAIRIANSSDERIYFD